MHYLADLKNYKKVVEKIEKFAHEYKCSKSDFWVSCTCESCMYRANRELMNLELQKAEEPLHAYFDLWNSTSGSTIVPEDYFITVDLWSMLQYCAGTWLWCIAYPEGWGIQSGSTSCAETIKLADADTKSKKEKIGRVWHILCKKYPALKD